MNSFCKRKVYVSLLICTHREVEKITFAKIILRNITLEIFRHLLKSTCLTIAAYSKRSAIENYSFGSRLGCTSLDIQVTAIVYVPMLAKKHFGLLAVQHWGLPSELSALPARKSNQSKLSKQLVSFLCGVFH